MFAGSASLGIIIYRYIYVFEGSSIYQLSYSNVLPMHSERANRSYAVDQILGPEYTMLVVNHNMPVIETFHTLMCKVVQRTHLRLWTGC